MKKKQSLSTGISALIVAVLIVIAFFRGDIQVWLLSSVLVVWGLWATITYLLPRIRKTQKEKRRMERRNKHEQASISERGFYVPELSDDPVGLVLKRHVNHRISAYLRSVYSDATWEWCEEQPEHIIAKGGTGRIQIYGVPDFNYAEVKLDQHANINCSMLRIVPIGELSQDQPTPVHKPTSPIDPQIWYEAQARGLLEDLVTDLNSRGHSSLIIRENGDVCIQQGDSERAQVALQSLPDKVYWPRLSKVFEREGLAANVKDDCIVLSW